MGFVGVQSHDPQRLFAGFIDRDKSHRTRVVEIDQSRDELMRKLLDRIEETKSQIFLAHVSHMIADQVLVVRSDRPDKYSPAIPKDEMPLPLRRIRASIGHQSPFLAVAPAPGPARHNLAAQRTSSPF